MVVEVAAGHPPTNEKFDQKDKFRQLEEILPTANTFRTASGAPGPQYWQQKVDYQIDVTLDDVNQRIIGSEAITYHNNSPDTLRYLWLQLDNNIFAPHSDNVLAKAAPDFENMSFEAARRLLVRDDFDGSVNVTAVTDAQGNPLAHTIVKTMMRVDLAEPLAPGHSTTVSIDWNYSINDSKDVRGRTACEYFEDDDNYIYELAHWFPRLAAYTDSTGWQHKQFLGSGEFTLEFGDYTVNITAPDDHIVAATGVLQNPDSVLTQAQRQRLEDAKTAQKPVFIVTPNEAEANEHTTPAGVKTWAFHAENVRDFAFASSRKFIWDAKRHDVEGNPVMAMSFYPNEGEPLWSRYSTHAIMHTLDVYSRFTFAYPYPVAISVNGPVGGMEYPMICFNGPRPEEDGTYSKRTKYGLISVIIHEVGHNYFPMIVNSDERQWTWMDEGLNSFVQFLAQNEWEDDYPRYRAEPREIVEYMASENQVPIMTNSESLLQFGNNAYAKTATALNVLRETVLGRELFDFAFKEYSRRWMFKRPAPADFFRTMEDASGVDLDWFWRGWFYSTDHVDIGIDRLRLYTIDTRDPSIEKAQQRAERDAEPRTWSEQRNADLPKRIDEFPELHDFYNDFDELDITDEDREAFEQLLEELDDDERELLRTSINFYVIELSNLGGLVMPLTLDVEYQDGSAGRLHLPAEIWRYDNQHVSKLIMTTRTISRISLDPVLESADIDVTNNVYPREPETSRFQLQKEEDELNPMQRERDRHDDEADPDHEHSDENDDSGG